MNATTAMLVLSLGLLLPTTAFAKGRSVVTTYPQTVNSNKAVVQLNPLEEVPEWMAVIIQTNNPIDVWDKNRQAAMTAWRVEVRTNHNAKAPPMPKPSDSQAFENPHWLPFHTNLTVDLGSGDGRREIMFSFRYKGQSIGDGWRGGGIVVQTQLPTIAITDPKQLETSRPVVQLNGYVSSNAKKIKFDLYDQNGVKTIDNQNGLVTDTYFDKSLWRTTTNYFQCYDVPLNPGTNTFVFRCEDVAGNQFGTNFVIVFSTVGDKTPPVIRPKFPAPGTVVEADAFIVHGMLDDPTANLTGQLLTGEKVQEIAFRVGRYGDYYSVQEVAVSTTTSNLLILTATDAAGNRSSTNIHYYAGEARITMDAFDPFHPVGPWITLTGKVSPANCSVWVDGVPAQVEPDGSWRVERVPDRRIPSGGWVFGLTAIPPGGLTNAISKLKQSLSAQASLGTNPIVLNASTPACGIFQLHLNETSGRSFVLETSTNLTDWSAILTNSTSNPYFNYTDTNINKYSCRFFRVVPLQ
jgi:hypothetical protein